MKKILSLIICISVLVSFASVCSAENSVNILLNSEPLEFDAAPFIENNRTMVPVRAVFEAIGAQVSWSEDTKTIIIIRNDNDDFTSVVLQVGLDKAFVNNDVFELDAPAKIVSNRTFVPLRFIIEALGEDITWDEATRTVSIATK